MSENKYEKVLALLEECENNGDTEMAHADADDALVVALLIAGGEEVKPVIESYIRVKKWYA